MPKERPPYTVSPKDEAADAAPDAREVTIDEVIAGFGKPAETPEPAPHEGSAFGSLGDADSFIDTPREARGALEAVVSQFEDVSAKSSAEAERMAVRDAEDAYLIAFKQLEQKKTVWNRLAKGKDLKEESENVEALKRSYDEKRVAYAAALTESAKQRLAGKDRERADQVLERYNRIVRFKEVVKPAAEKRIAARREALDARGRNVFEKALGWSARQNQLLEKRLGKSGAVAVRALAGAIGVSGIAAVAGGFGAAALAGAGVYGLHKFARGFIGAYAGKLGGDLAGTFYEQRFGRSAQAAAKESLRTAGRTAHVSLETLQSLDALREKLSSRADEATLQRKKALVQALTAFGIGAGAAAALSDVFAVHHAADTAVASVATEPTSAPVPEIQDHATAAPETVTAQAPVTEAAPLQVDVPESIQAEAVVGKGEGFNQLFVDLRASGLSGDSPVVRHLLDPSMSATELSEEVKALIGENNAVTHVGDKLFVNGEGNLIFEREGVQQVLMENTKDGLSVHALNDVDLREIHSPSASVVEEAAVADTDTAGAKVPQETEVPLGGPLEELTSPADAAPAYPTGIVGHSLDQFKTHQNMPQSEGAKNVTVGPSDTVGHSLDEFAPHHELGASDAHPETFTNVHGVEVNPTEPAAYAWKIPGTDTTITVSSGGTPEQQSAFARAYADTHPGATVHFVTPVFEDGVMKYRMDAWDSVEGTPAQRYTDIAPGGAPRAALAIGPEAFIRKLP